MYKIISLLAFLLFLAHTFSHAENTNLNFDLEEEAYVDDIPFNTSAIINVDIDTNRDTNISEPNFEIRRKMIIANTIMNIIFYLGDEENIDDIPFDTERIINHKHDYFNSTFNQGMIVEFQLEDEAYIDDIPFNTCDVINGIRP